MFFPNEENKIFEEDSMPLYCTSSKTEEEMPNLEKIKIVQLDKKNLQNLKTSLL